MKKYFHSTVIALFLVLISFSRAQSVGIGELMPDIGIASIINYSKKSITMSDLKGKAIILDFWATWCGPCVEAFPKMDSLQKKFGDQLQILLVNNQNEKIAADFLDKINKVKGVSLPSILNDTKLNAAFKHQVIPHYVWISADGEVQAITGAEQITESNVLALVNNEKLSLRTKIDSKINTNMNKPVFLKSPQLPFKEEDVLYRSSGNDNYNAIITKYNPMVHGYTNKNSYTDSTSVRIISVNAPILWLYMYAFGKGDWEMLNVDNVKTEIQDSAKYIFSWNSEYDSDEYEEYVSKHAYCYELIVNPADSLRIFEIMQKDLQTYFGLQGSVEKISKTVWSLIRTDTTDRLQSTGGKEVESVSAYGLSYKNRPFHYFFLDINSAQSETPIINETGFSMDKRIDIDIAADLTDLHAVNEKLLKFGLKLIEKIGEKDVIVVREAKRKS